MSRLTTPTIYDTPELLASMALDGEFTARGAQDAVFNPTRLSPSERDTISTRIKTAAGNTSVGNALIDVAMNPWTWLFFVTSPPGTRALAESASGLTSIASKYLHSVGRQSGVMSALGLLTGNLVTDPHTQEVLHAATDRWRSVAANGYKAIGETPDLDLSGILDDSTRAVRMENAALVNAKLSGLYRDRLSRAPQLDSETGALKWVEQTAPRMVDPAVLDQRIAERNLGQYVDRFAAFRDQRAVETFGVDGAADFTADPRKIANAWRGLRNPALSGEGGRGIQAVRELLSDDLLAKVAGGDLSQGDFEKMVTESFTGAMDQSNYVPRNVYVKRGVVGELDREARRSGSNLGATFSAVPRDVDAAKMVWDLDSLDALKRAVGDAGVVPEVFGDEYAATQKAIATAQTNNTYVRTLTMDPAAAFRKYNADTARTIAWHGDVPTPPEWQAFHEWADQTKAAGADKPFDPSILDKPKRSWSEDFRLIDMDENMPEGVGPVGGVNRADMLLSGWAYNQDKYSRNAIERVLVPAVMGRRSVQHTFTEAVMRHTQRAASWFADSNVGQGLEDQGSWPKKFVETLRDYGNADVTDPEQLASSTTRNVAAYMQTVMLGASLSSVLVNATQPLGPAAVLLGFKNTVKGMGKAIQELGGYVTDRVGTHGIGPITDETRQALVNKHFWHADIAGLASNPLEMLDRDLFGGSRGIAGHGMLDTFRHYMLGAFGYAEWFNRSATAHAVESAFEEAGHAVRAADGSLTPEFSRAARRLVQETQFGSDPMNVPLAFMSNDPDITKLGSVLANPLARQFLPFAIRSLTTLTHYGPRFAGRENRAGSILNDFARGMAISSVLYEGSKDLFGVDLSPSLYFATTTDILPLIRSGRYDKNESPLPIPPIIDTLYSAAKSLADGDRQMIGRSFVRLVPGGVALSRAMDVMPQLPGPFSAPQRTYIGWDSPTPDGTVPVYDGKTGNMVDAVSPVQAVLHGIGADLGWWNARGDATKFLLDNQAEMNQYRQQFVGAMLAGDTAGQASIGAEFTKRFKMPLKVSQAQLQAAMNNRSAPRADRIIRQMPPDVRPTYQALVQGGQAPVAAPETAAPLPGAPGFESFGAF